MNAMQYQKIHAWFTARPAALRWLNTLYRYSAGVVALCYLVLVAYHGYACLAVFMSGREMTLVLQDFLVVVLVPAMGYVAGSLLRARLNYPRPYQQEGFTPLIRKEKQGHAFPSRHAVSASVIAVTWWGTSPVVSLLLGAMVVLICAVRVLAGVHSLRDVVAGVAFGGLFGAFVIVSLYRM